MAAPIAQILQILMSTGLGQQLMDQLYLSGTGGNIFGFTPSNYDPSKTLAYNFYAKREAERANNMFGDAVAHAVSENSKRYAEGFYRALGYKGGAATDKANANNPVQNLILSTLVEPRLRNAASRMQAALYARKDQWDVDARFRDPQDPHNRPGARWEAYSRAGSSLIESVMHQAVSGGFSGMGVEDVSAIAARMIGVGAFAERPTKGGKQTGEDPARIKRFKLELESYADSIHTLQDVIDGPVEDIMNAFEQLTGSKMVSTSHGRVSQLANAARNVLSKGVIDAGTLGRITSAQYQMIAPYGGTQMQAAGMGLVTGAMLSAGVRVEGVSDQQLANTITKMNARSLADGSQRAAAGAYAHFLAKNGLENNDISRARFMNEIGNSRLSFKASVAKYIQENHVSNAELYSARATNLMGNPEFTAAMHMGALQSFEKGVSRQLQAKGIGGDRLSRIMSLVKSVQDPAVLESELIKEFGNGYEGRQRAQSVANIIKYQATRATGETNEYAALAGLGSIRNGARILQENRSQAAWKMLANYKGENGIAGMFQALVNAGGNDVTVGDMLGGFFGLDPRKMTEIARHSGLIVNGKVDKGRAEAFIDRSLAEMGIKKNDKEYEAARNATMQMLGTANVNRAYGFRVAMLDSRAGQDAKATFLAKTKLMNDLANAKDEEAVNAALKQAEKTLILGDFRDEIIYRQQTGRLGNDAPAIDRKELEDFRAIQKFHMDKLSAKDRKDAKKVQEATKTAAAEAQAKGVIRTARAAHRAAGKKFDVKELAQDEEIKKMAKRAGITDKKEIEGWLAGLSQDNSVEGWLERILSAIESIIKVEEGKK